MATPVIQVEDLSKKYRLFHAGNQSTGLRHVIEHVLRHPLDFLKKEAHVSNSEEFWALKDVSFELNRGEVLGVIGRNGAGKSTLLKILSRITEPTIGKIHLRGRVASLLEVGTGFHPELTGRENISLNGAILGMSRAEIKKKFDEIVAFAEVEKFIDTPVKRYSSGMYVRLAFAVAAHLEPDILIVDEVLAVGDAAFQKKCLGKMQDVSTSEGRTVLVVSHNMAVVQELATKAIYLEKGGVIGVGKPSEIIGKYLSSTHKASDSLIVDLTNHPGRLGGMKPIFKSLFCHKGDGIPARDFLQSDPIQVHIEYQAPENISLSGIGFGIYTTRGIRVAGFNNYMTSPPPHIIPPKGKFLFKLDPGQLTPGEYLLTPSTGYHSSVLADRIENCFQLNVHPSDIYKTGYLLTPEDGVFALRGSIDVLT